MRHVPWERFFLQPRSWLGSDTGSRNPGNGEKGWVGLCWLSACAEGSDPTAGLTVPHRRDWAQASIAWSHNRPDC